ncbi:MAG: MATE family efflux transporter [Armatimonadota bacterium]|nr:MATE family efflux transporter [Armatimonadota bacterium]
MALDSVVGAQRESDGDPASEEAALLTGVAETEAVETNRNLHRAVWLLAWPSVLTMLLQTFNSFLDRFFVGHLGSDALAAVGVGGQFMFLLFSVGMSISVGTSALVARFTGAKENDQATLAANQSVWIGFIAAFVCMAAVWPMRYLVVGWMGVDAHAAALCVQYLTVTLLGIPALFLMLILGSVFRGLGDTVTPLRVMIGVNIIHLGGDWLLIFGHWGFPRMGLVGGATALIASQVIGALLYLWFLRHSPVHGLMTRLKRLEMDWTRRILNIGLPAAGQNLSRVLSMMIFTAVLARSPQATAAVAALTIGLTSESIAFMPGFAFSIAAATLTGQNLGAGKPERAERAAWMALQQGMGVMIFMGAVFFLMARPFTHIFTHDPAVVPLAVGYLRIAALSEPFLALGMILMGALNGAGDTKAPALVSVVTMWGVRLPLAWLAISVLSLGTLGAWWAMAISTTLNGLAALALFKWGRWKQTVV